MLKAKVSKRGIQFEVKALDPLLSALSNFQSLGDLRRSARLLFEVALLLASHSSFAIVVSAQKLRLDSYRRRALRTALRAYRIVR